MDLRERFGANLRRARLRGGFSQEELGLRCDLHRTEIVDLERGERQPQLETLVKLAGGLGISPGRLCEGIAWSPREGLTVAPTTLPPGRVKRPPARPPSR